MYDMLWSTFESTFHQLGKSNCSFLLRKERYYDHFSYGSEYHKLYFLLQKTIASPGRGILAMDESNATCGKRLDSIGLENTEANRQAYRTLLVSAPGLGQYISGAILFEETLYQSTVDGKKIVDVLNEQGIVPGIKVDKVCCRLQTDT